MNLQKTLIRLYRKSTKLGEARIKSKELKKSFIKFNANEDLDISNI